MKLIAFSVLITAVASAQATLHQNQQTTPILPGPTTFAVHYKDSVYGPYPGENVKREVPAPQSIIWDNDIKRENPGDPGFAPEGDNGYSLPGENSGSPLHADSEEAGSKGPETIIWDNVKRAEPAPQTIIWDNNVKRGKPGDPGYTGPNAQDVKYPFPGENSGGP